MQISLDQIDPDALRVVQRLRRFQHQAFLVGGCVRDLLLGRKPKDFDVATSATPNEIRRTFRNCRIIGRRFRLAHVFFGRKIIETATFRANPRTAEDEASDLQGSSDQGMEGQNSTGSENPSEPNEVSSPPSDGATSESLNAAPDFGQTTSESSDSSDAQPADAQSEASGEPAAQQVSEAAEGVSTDGSSGDKTPNKDLYIRRDNVFGTAEEDARRRDFTINGLFFDVDTKQVIDHVNGLPDLEARLVRTIGDPDIRFREDPVRILRAVKFAARCDLTIEPETYRSMMEHKRDLAKCAQPRVTEEFYRLLRMGAGKRSFELLLETGLLEVLLPELDRGLRSESPNVKRFWSYLEALDASLPDHREPPSDAMILSTLLLPPLRDMLDPKAAPAANIGQAIADSIAPILDRLKASRRDSEVCRQILMALRYLLPCSTRRRQHRLEGRPFFPDALWLAQVVAKAEGTNIEAEPTQDASALEAPVEGALPVVEEEIPAELLVDAEPEMGRRGRGYRDRQARTENRPEVRTDPRPEPAAALPVASEPSKTWEVGKPRPRTEIPAMEWLVPPSDFRPAFLGNGTFGGRWAARSD